MENVENPANAQEKERVEEENLEEKKEVIATTIALPMDLVLVWMPAWLNVPTLVPVQDGKLVALTPVLIQTNSEESLVDTAKHLVDHFNLKYNI